MKLLNDALKERFKEVGRQEDNPLVIAKFFHPVSSATWYVTEYEASTRICYGYVTGLFKDEWGYFSLDELEAFHQEVYVNIDGALLPAKVGIERDVHFTEVRVNDLNLTSS
jgi:hypothetical protein